MITIQPLADRVLIKPSEVEKKTASGIIIPDMALDKSQQGEVMAIGNGRKDEPMTVKIGDKVIYGKYSGTEISHEGLNYIIMREQDIILIIKD